MDLAPEELVRYFLSEMERNFGPEFASQVICIYRKPGLFFVSFPRREGDKWVKAHFSKPLRRLQLMGLLESI